MTSLPREMLKVSSHKLASLQSRAWLPPALLLIALASVFLFGGDRGYLYKTGPHDYMTEKNLAIAENFSLKNNLLLFTRQTLDVDGESIYEPYTRFPIGSYALIKLSTLPFGYSMSAKVSVARMVMLLFFAAAAFLAYLSLRRITASRWIALTATLLAFSSPFCLYYNDVISSEVMVDLFAVMLVFHGIVIFEQDGRFRQLPIKACAALLLGWHVYAMLLAFIAFGAMREVIKARSSISTHSLALRQLKSTTLSLLRSRYMALGVISLVFGVSLLAFNFTNEYFALNREVPLTELSSVRSALNRTSIDPVRDKEYATYLSWPTFPERQFYRIGVMVSPYIFSPSYVLGHMSYNVIEHPETPPRLFVVLGMAVSVASLMGLLFVRRHKFLLALLALSGFFWALPMRYTTALPWHEFEGIFYIGVTLTLFSVILLWLRRRVDEWLIAALSVAALLVFIASGLRMAQPIDTVETYETYKAIVADLEPIRDIATEIKGQVIWNKVIHDYVLASINYYLAGGVLVSRKDEVTPSARAPDFIITQVRLNGLTSLTPRNQVLFLYEWNAHKMRLDEMIEQAGEPIIRSDFDVHRNGNTLIYAGDDCSNIRTEPNVPFFLAVYPEDEGNLPVERRQHGFDNLDFYFLQRVVQRSERCIIIAPPLPDYDIARIYTGQYIQQADGSTQHIWEGDVRLTEAAR